MRCTATLQDFPIFKSIAPIRVQIGLFTAEPRRKALIVHLGRKVMIVDEDVC